MTGTRERWCARCKESFIIPVRSQRRYCPVCAIVERQQRARAKRDASDRKDFGDLAAYVDRLTDAELKARQENLRVRLVNRHATSHIDVLLLERVMYEAKMAHEIAVYRLQGELDGIKEAHGYEIHDLNEECDLAIARAKHG